MSPGANKRQTGTVPKAKTSRKNPVPQEMMVAPTRRDLQQHLNVSIPEPLMIYIYTYWLQERATNHTPYRTNFI